MTDKLFDPQSPTFHLELKAKRVELGISQYDLALALATTRATVARWEKPPGHHLACRPDTRLRRALESFFSNPTVLLCGTLTIDLAKRLLAKSLSVDESAIDIIVRY